MRCISDSSSLLLPANIEIFPLIIIKNRERWDSVLLNFETVLLIAKTESSNYYARQQTAVARGLFWPARRLMGRQTAAAPKHSLCFSVGLPYVRFFPDMSSF